MMKTFKLTIDLVIEWVTRHVVVFLSGFKLFSDHKLFWLPRFERSYVKTDNGLICIYTTSHKGFLNVWWIEEVTGDRGVDS